MNKANFRTVIAGTALAIGLGNAACERQEKPAQRHSERHSAAQNIDLQKDETKVKVDEAFRRRVDEEFNRVDENIPPEMKQLHGIFRQKIPNIVSMSFREWGDGKTLVSILTEYGVWGLTYDQASGIYTIDANLLGAKIIKVSTQEAAIESTMHIVKYMQLNEKWEKTYDIHNRKSFVDFLKDSGHGDMIGDVDMERAAEREEMLLHNKTLDLQEGGDSHDHP